MRSVEDDVWRLQQVEVEETHLDLQPPSRPGTSARDGWAELASRPGTGAKDGRAEFLSAWQKGEERFQWFVQQNHEMESRLREWTRQLGQAQREQLAQLRQLLAERRALMSGDDEHPGLSLRREDDPQPVRPATVNSVCVRERRPRAAPPELNTLNAEPASDSVSVASSDCGRSSGDLESNGKGLGATTRTLASTSQSGSSQFNQFAATGKTLAPSDGGRASQRPSQRPRSSAAWLQENNGLNMNEPSPLSPICRPQVKRAGTLRKMMTMMTGGGGRISEDGDGEKKPNLLERKTTFLQEAMRWTTTDQGGRRCRDWAPLKLLRLDEFWRRQELFAESIQKQTAEAKQSLTWQVVHGSTFQTVVCAAIGLNAVFIGLSADRLFEHAVEGTPPEDHWHQIDVAFGIFFTIELLLRIYSERKLFLFGPEWKWNFMDSVLVLVGLFDIIMSAFTEDLLANLATSRVIRVVRFFRVLRLVRTVRAFHSFRMVIYAILHSMSSLFWCFLVVSFIIYVFAIFFINAVAEHFIGLESAAGGSACGDGSYLDNLREYYGSVPRACVTLFMTISGGIDWYDTMKGLREIHWVYTYVFAGYIFFMFLGVLNVVVGAFVATTGEIASKDREALIKQEMNRVDAYTKKIKTFFEEADLDRSGMLSWEEFKNHLHDNKVKAYFQAMELDVSRAHKLFQILDADHSDQVGLDEFLDGCMRLKGQAKSIDVNMLMYENEQMHQKLLEFMRFTSSSFDDIFDKLGIMRQSRIVFDNLSVRGSRMSDQVEQFTSGC